MRETRIRAGRILLFKPEHPYAHKNGYILRSHLVIEAVIGRYVLPGEDVHHINEIKDDDRPANLQLLTRSAHMKYHLKKRHAERARMTAGLSNGRAKLSRDNVDAIQAALAAGRSQDSIALDFGVCQRTISLIHLRRHWANRPAA